VVKESRPSEKVNVRQLTLKKDKINSKLLTENVSSESSKLYPTDIGTLVNNFLCRFFEDIVDYNFTANVEKEFDEIALGQIEWNHVIKEFYGSFHQNIVHAEENLGKFSGEKLLGKDPATGKNVYVKIGRFGPIAQIGETESDEKPKFAGLRKNQSIDSITLEEALKLFDFPRLIGSYNDEDVLVSVGRFGPYISHNKKFFSLKKDDNPATIDLDRAIEIILEKQEKEKQMVIKVFPEDEEVRLLNGRYGPYLVINKKNFKLPKGVDPGSLTIEDCRKIAADPENTPKKRFVKRKK
jgi:DNA topoisomerase-1